MWPQSGGTEVPDHTWRFFSQRKTSVLSIRPFHGWDQSRTGYPGTSITYTVGANPSYKVPSQQPTGEFDGGTGCCGTASGHIRLAVTDDGPIFTQ